MFPDGMCLGEGLYVELFLLVLLIGFRDGKETEPFWLKPILIKEMFYAFSQKNKVFYKILGIDRYHSSCRDIIPLLLLNHVFFQAMSSICNMRVCRPRLRSVAAYPLLA